MLNISRFDLSRIRALRRFLETDRRMGEEVERAARLLATHAPGSPVFLQPVTPLGGSPAVPREALDSLVDAIHNCGLDVRVVPQVHKVLRVR